ncbi:hypothetical protein AAFG13_03030 [Bradyrhizobium sp. B124]|uniref:hypothetical protein n=1 Tax=Bradyrhizobium sp. B124 TaxID=3140245 RepID=UPI0031840822
MLSHPWILGRAGEGLRYSGAAEPLVLFETKSFGIKSFNIKWFNIRPRFGGAFVLR